jgi:hypothetical protein
VSWLHPKAKPLRGRFRLLLLGFQSHYFRPQPLDLVGGFAHRGPGVEVNRNAVGLLAQQRYTAMDMAMTTNAHITAMATDGPIMVMDMGVARATETGRNTNLNPCPLDAAGS